MFTILLFTCAIRCDAQTQAKGESGIKAVKLKQTHYAFGKMDIVASKSGLRLESLGSWKFVLVAKAPDWNVTVFRRDDKIFYSCSLKLFKEGGLANRMVVHNNPRMVVGRKQQSKFVFEGNHATRLVTPYLSCEYFPCENLIAPEVESILYAAYRVPTCGGLPLRYILVAEGKDWMTGVDETGERQVMLDTTSVSAIRAPSVLYSAPVGYKLSKSIREVLISSEARKSSEDANVLFDFHEPTKRK